MTVPSAETAVGALRPVALARPGSRVLLVGTSRHPEGSPLPDIDAVEASLKGLAAVLHQQVGVPEANVRVLLDPPSPLEFGNAVRQAAQEADDALLVHFIGHGLVGSDDGLCLATGATDDLVDGLSWKALRYQAFRETIRDSRARAVAVMLDCCFSGRAEPPLGPPALDAVFEQSLVRGGFLLTSTAREELGLARPGSVHTAFTGALIRLLRDGDPTGPQELTLDHAYRHLARVLPEEGAPRPRRHSSDRAGDMVIAHNPAYRLRPAPAPEELSPTAAETATDGEEVPCPFRGLESFGPDDARYFFGRDGVIEDLVARVRGRGLIAVVGASGCGKTSLLRAGVVPALEALGEGWSVASMKPGADPGRALARCADALSGSDRAVLLVDQFEELFTAGAPERERERFVGELTALADGGTTVVIAIRADFYEACTRYPSLVRALETHQVVVGPLEPENLRAVIEQPARVAGLRLEEGLADTLLREARVRRLGVQSAVLPLLSHALLATWQQRSGSLLTLAGYRATGGVDDAISTTAEQVYAGMSPEDRALLRNLLLRLVHIGEGVEDTRRRLSLVDLAGPEELAAPARVLDALAAARLVTVDGEGVEMAHEALLYAWARLRAWIDEDRAALLALQQLSDAARVWEQAGRQASDLYRGHRLEAAAHAVGEHERGARALGPAARAFLDNGLREQRAARRRSRRVRMFTAVLVTLALVASVLGLVAERKSAWEGQQAAQKAAVVRSTGLAADAEAIRTTDPGLAAQLAVAAYHSSPTQDAATQLYASLNTPLDGVLAKGSPVVRLATQPDGPLAADSDRDKSLRIWNLADPSAPVLESKIPAGGAAVAIAPGGRLLSGYCPTGKGLCLWNLADPRHPRAGARLPAPRRPAGRRTQISAMAISPDGRTLAAAAEQGFTLLWSIADPAHPRLLAELPDPASEDLIAGVAFAPRGHLLAQTNLRGKTQIWNVADPATPKKVTTISTGYQSVAFSPDGKMMAAAGDASLGLWRIGDPAHPKSISVFTGITPADLESVAFSPDGSRLAYGGIDTDDPKSALCQVSLAPSNLKNSAQPDCTSTGFDTFTVAYTAHADILTGGRDGAVRLWRRPLAQAGGMSITGRDVWSMSPDGRTFAAPRLTTSATSVTSTSPSAVGIWRAPSAASEPVLRGTVPLPAMAQMVLFLNSKVLLTVTHNGAVQLWDVHDIRHPAKAASLGTVDFPTTPSGLGDFIISTGVTSDQAGDLVSVQRGGRLVLWRVKSARDATEAGSLPLPDPKSDIAGFVDRHTACVLTKNGISWWNINDPDHPVHRATSAVHGANQGSLTAAAGVVAGTTGVSDSGATLSLFALTDGRPRSAVPLPGVVGSTLGISVDGHLVAAAGAGDNTVTLWDTRDLAHPHALGTNSTLTGTTGIAFAPNDKLMADWSDDNDPKVQLWSTHPSSSPTLLADFAPPGDSTIQLTAEFTPSSAVLAVAASSSVTLYDSNPLRLADTLCSYAGHPITRSQWKKYAPSAPYGNPCPGKD
ncbi:caspase family protein [Streptomyces sp. NPDC050523]|uniref:caspase, EACC1-associated type n=1 Tax=Streptomyces sp. NPDC050523 TaxID=3365622 RepID=UPI0037B64A5D